jgi:serine/threonine protein kinase
MKDLAYSKDDQGRILLHIMHKEVAEYFKQRIFFLGRYELQGIVPIHCSATSVVFPALDHGIERDYEEIFFHFASSNMPTETDKWLDIETFLAAVRLCNRLYECDVLQNNHDLESRYIEYSVEDKMTIASWLDFCKRQFGAVTRSVAIKFMQEEDQFYREINSRKSELEPCVLGILNSFTPETPLGNQESRMNTIGDIMLPNGKNLTADYSYGIILLAADRNLDTIYRSERPDLPHIKVMMQEIGEALKHCHQNGIIHGDLKMMNVVRVKGKMRLIDLDASAVMNQDSFGMKFSSGVLPPEMFHHLSDKTSFDEYNQVSILINCIISVLK